ncbi:hypothetical protein [Nitrospirillum iridis]|uniref:UrcA family protein n=1 Tax=Nitrospirillum iridis TaxID=765888 RepID=A0A7X0AWT0_9PROT|nr:hypothetical protein [Nitrospirillum iridis]MBB6250540.1 hypothetical protein [Nitrospirillum iridis]
MNTRTLSAATKSIAAALMIAATFATPAAFAMPVTASDTMTIQHTCQQTLGLTINDTDYAACVSTLSQALATAMPHERRGVPSDNAACAEVGLMPGTTGYSRCVANLDGALAQAQLSPN